MTVTMWARKLGIKEPTIRGRYYSGKSHEECLSLSTLKIKGVKYNKMATSISGFKLVKEAEYEPVNK